MTEETYKQQMKDSDMIFTQISTSGIDNYADANRLIVQMYFPDMSISRAGISHALKRLKAHYKEGITSASSRPRSSAADAYSYKE